MSQKLPAGGFKWKKNMLKFNGDFIKNYDQNSDEGYIHEVDAAYPTDLHDLHSGLSFLLERMKIHKCDRRLRRLRRSLSM